MLMWIGEILSSWSEHEFQIWHMVLYIDQIKEKQTEKLLNVKDFGCSKLAISLVIQTGSDSIEKRCDRWKPWILHFIIF